MSLPENADEEQVRLMAEQCILLDENDNVIGANSKKFCHLWTNIEEGKALHRAFSVFLFNSKNELLLQQRSHHKITFPLRWTNTCCSHPLHMESELKSVEGVKNAAIRKLEHELGIPVDTLTPDDFVYLTRIIYKAPSDTTKWGEHEIDYLLFARADIDDKIKIVENEVAATQYVTPQQLKDLIASRVENEITISPWFHMIMDKFGYEWWNRIDEIMENKGLNDDTIRDTIHPCSIEKDITS